MTFARLLLLSGMFGFCGCAQPTEVLRPGAQNIELLRFSELGGADPPSCRQVETFDLVIVEEIPAPEMDATFATRARNRGLSIDATHVLLYPSAQRGCDGDDQPVEEGGTACWVAPVTAYRCIVGR